MSVLPIVTYNDPVLRQPAKEIPENSSELQTLIDDMFATMYHASGVGLAAPQIGKSIQLFVLDIDEIAKDAEEECPGPLVFINPEITKKSEEKVKMEEGCLSIPEVRDDVMRASEITVRYFNRDFKPETLGAGGWLARVIQHEYDHLQGVLFLDYLSAFRRRFHKNVLKKIDAGLLEADYPLAAKKEPENS